MKFTIQPSGVKVVPDKKGMACDVPLHKAKHIPEMLPDHSFSMCISAPPGSGKTTLFVWLLTQVYKKSFDRIYIFMPESSRKSITNKLMKEHFQRCESQCFDDFNAASLSAVLEKVEQDYKNNKHSLILADDVSCTFKGAGVKSKELTTILKKCLTNRRHLKLSMILSLHTFNMVDLVLRKQFSHCIFFPAANLKESLSFSEETFGLDKKDGAQLMKAAFRKKHDFLYLINSIPKRYFRCFDEIFIEDSDDETDETDASGCASQNEHPEDSEPPSDARA